ncbi:MAG: hypothetical protein A2Y10_07185 [Planctomycetes bacterium GWF2_41_51]|nr:MAG: hypothetical protein A2Y10_07185 [Planctomycetes bacterium GWF2_41_51]HBG28512.1 hypothetical protein [Phycisphaerales bacterium]
MQEQNESVRPSLPIELVKQLNLYLGLSISSLVLGIMAISLSIAVIGLPLGIIGVILGIVCLAKRSPFGKGIAIWGVSLSILGVLAGIFFTYLFYYKTYKTYKDMAASTKSEMSNEWLGKPSPDFNVTDLNGNTIKLSDLKGKRVILDFWATWCPPCKKEIPSFIKLRNEIDPNNLVIIGISSEPEETLKIFVEENEINYQIASADDLPEPYDRITSIPTTFFIDSNGIIQQVLNGYHDYETLHENAVMSDYAEPNFQQLFPEPVEVKESNE